MSKLRNISELPLKTIQYFNSYNPGNRIIDIVKELIENSIDAESTAISISLENGGYTSLIVQDNGFGIPYQSLPNACKYFTTSKMKTIDEFENVNTYGFRGCTLAFFSCISNILITTKTEKDDKSYSCNFSYNIAINSSNTESELTTGTIVELRDLLYNYPEIRKKRKLSFIEAARVERVILKYAILYPYISFRLYSNNNKLIETSQSHDPTEILKYFQIHGNNHDFVFYHSTINLEDIGKLEYYVSNFVKTFKSWARGIYINNRLVSCPEIKKEVDALYNEYRKKNGITDIGKPPYFFFFTMNLDKGNIQQYFLTKTVQFPQQKSLITVIRNIIICEFKHAEELLAENPSLRHSSVPKPNSKTSVDPPPPPPQPSSQLSPTHENPSNHPSIPIPNNKSNHSPQSNTNQPQQQSSSYGTSANPSLAINILKQTALPKEQPLLFQQRAKMAFSGESLLEESPPSLISTLSIPTYTNANLPTSKDDRSRGALDHGKNTSQSTNNSSYHNANKIPINNSPTPQKSAPLIAVMKKRRNSHSRSSNNNMITINPYEELKKIQGSHELDGHQMMHNSIPQLTSYQYKPSSIPSIQLQKANTDTQFSQAYFGSYNNNFVNPTPSSNAFNSQNPVQMAPPINPYLFNFSSTNLPQYSSVQQPQQSQQLKHSHQRQQKKYQSHRKRGNQFNDDDEFTL